MRHVRRERAVRAGGSAVSVTAPCGPTRCSGISSVAVTVSIYRTAENIEWPVGGCEEPPAGPSPSERSRRLHVTVTGTSRCGDVAGRVARRDEICSAGLAAAGGSVTEPTGPNIRRLHRLECAHVPAHVVGSRAERSCDAGTRSWPPSPNPALFIRRSGLLRSPPRPHGLDGPPQWAGVCAVRTRWGSRRTLRCGMRKGRTVR